MNTAHRDGTGVPALWTGLLLLAAVLSAGFVAGFALPYVGLDRDVLERFAGREMWIWTHVAAGMVALAIGPETCGWGRRAGALGRIACWAGPIWGASP